jgi:hypothetical protein
MHWKSLSVKETMQRDSGHKHNILINADLNVDGVTEAI